MLSAIWNVEMTHRSICLPDFPAVSQVRRSSRQVSAACYSAGPIYSSCLQLGRLSPGAFAPLSQAFGSSCVTRSPSHHTPWRPAESCVLLQVPHNGLCILFRSYSRPFSSSFRIGRGAGNRKLEAVMMMSANTLLFSVDTRALSPPRSSLCARVAGKVVCALGMYRSRPQQNGFCLFYTLVPA